MFRRMFIPLIILLLAVIALPASGQVIPFYALFAPEDVPDTCVISDPSTETVGIAFTTSMGGWISGAMVFSSGDVNSHSVKLWEDGTEIASGTASGYSTGWNEVTFQDFIAIQPGSEYVISEYGSPAMEVCNFASGYYELPVTVGPLTVSGGLSGSGDSLPSMEGELYAVNPVFFPDFSATDPTPTLGPDYVRIPLSSGHNVELQYTATMGEIAVTIAVISICVILLILAVLFLPRVFL